MSFPTPVGGSALRSRDHVASIIFSAIHGLLVPTIIYRLVNKRSRTLLISSTLSVLIERCATISRSSKSDTLLTSLSVCRQNGSVLATGSCCPDKCRLGWNIRIYASFVRPGLHLFIAGCCQSPALHPCRLYQGYRVHFRERCSPRAHLYREKCLMDGQTSVHCQSCSLFRSFERSFGGSSNRSTTSTLLVSTHV